MEFAENLRMLRKKAGLTQTEAANRIGISFQSYNKYEKGKAEPSFKTLSNIAMTLNTDINTLVGFKNKNTKESATRMQIRFIDTLIEALSDIRDDLNEI